MAPQSPIRRSKCRLLVRSLPGVIGMFLFIVLGLCNALGLNWEETKCTLVEFQKEYVEPTSGPDTSGYWSCSYKVTTPLTGSKVKEMTDDLSCPENAFGCDSGCQKTCYVLNSWMHEEDEVKWQRQGDYNTK